MGEPNVETLRRALKDRIDEAETEGLRLAQSWTASLPLKKAYNTLSPPNRIPVEILSHILLIHSASFLDSPDASRNRKGLERIRIAHVCHRWRQVGLGCGEL